MSTEEFSHLSPEGTPRMVDVSAKTASVRTARAEAVIDPGPAVLKHFVDQDIITKKGSVFHTSIIAGVMGAKKTSELIPFCHPLSLEDCQIQISVVDKKIRLESRVLITGKTGVEMEALTAVTVAALTFYDMCKALSHDIVIERIRLVEKTGGKKDFTRSLE